MGKSGNRGESREAVTGEAIGAGAAAGAWTMTGGRGTVGSLAVQVTQGNQDQHHSDPHPLPKQREVRAHTAGELLQTQVESSKSESGGILGSMQPREVLEFHQVWMMKVEIAEVFQGMFHLRDLSGWQQSQWVPFPVEMQDLTCEYD
jgi:hypothetical protein